MDNRNRLRERLEAGDVVLGAGSATYSPAVIEVYGHVGLDFVWLDFEHGGPSPWDAGTIEELTQAAETADIELLVRIPSEDPPLVRKVLDAGARTLLIPRVETAEQVRTAVEASRFTYEGEPGDRGVGMFRATTWGNPSEDQPTREDDAVMVGAMIENTTAVENLEEILAVPELGFVFIGAADLSVSMGVPWEWSDPDVRETVDEIVARATEADVPVGAIQPNPEGAVEAIDEGYQLLFIGGEIGAAQQVLSERMDAIERGRKR